MIENLEIAIETLVAVILVAASGAILYLRPRRFAGKGGNVVMAGAILVAIGTLVDWLDEFEHLASVLAVDSPIAQLVIEKILGYGLGFALLYIGLVTFIRRHEAFDERSEMTLEEQNRRNEELERLVRERTTEITVARQLAESANAAKSRFLANMSHELRTPMNAILGFSGAMQERILGPIGNEKYEEYVDNIHESGQHLLELINDMLDLAKVEADAVDLEDKPVDLADVSEAVLRLVRPQAEKGRIRVTNRVDTDLPALTADERRLKQILVNLLSNAVKFTEPGGEVVLEAHVEGDSGLAMVVSDTGIGMSPQEIETALLPFGQVDSSLARSHQGTGLGLPLTRSLVDLHGGTMAVDSQRGQGTTVTVRFPPERVAAAH